MSREEAADPFRHVFDGPMASRSVQALGPDDLPQAQLADILGRIGTTLKRHQQSGSWGTIVRLGNVGVEPVPTVVFGFREPTGIDIGEGWPLDLVVTHEPFSDGVAIPVTWINSACVERDVVSIAKVSLGVTTLTTKASSFGGYVRTASGDKFGVSAAHVTPEPIGSEVSCPSTVELTARLRNILPYTSLNPRSSRFHRFRDESDAEVKHMLSTYRISDDPDDGIELVGHQGKKILSGNRLGQIVAKELRHAAGIFAKHNLYLSQAGLRPFVLPTGQEHITHSKIDWVMFTVEDSRLGGNFYDPGDEEPVAGPVLLTPQDSVQKLGRTTGETYGTVNEAVVQKWADGHLTMEIGVISKNTGGFADLGDSGSLCMAVRSEVELFAGGLVVGINHFLNAALVTPMWAVLEDMTTTMGETVTFL